MATVHLFEKKLQCCFETNPDDFGRYSSRGQGELERTLQLFQLLIVVFGFYAALRYPAKYKNVVALSSIVTVIVLDRLEAFFSKRRQDAEEHRRARESSASGTAQAEKRLDALSHSRNNLMLIDAVQAVLREIGLKIVPCPEYSMVDRLLRLEDQVRQVGLKMLADAGALTKEWEHLERTDGGFIKGDGGELRLLLVVNNGVTPSGPGGAEFVKIPMHLERFLADRHTVAITTQTLGRIYQLCKDTGQDPQRIFNRIYKHPGGFFYL